MRGGGKILHLALGLALLMGLLGTIPVAVGSGATPSPMASGVVLPTDTPVVASRVASAELSGSGLNVA